jgi:hypothetical protein
LESRDDEGEPVGHRPLKQVEEERHLPQDAQRGTDTAHAAIESDKARKVTPSVMRRYRSEGGYFEQLRNDIAV